VAVPHPLDRDLTTRDVQGLANGDAVATFFTSLGYDTSGRLRQTTAAMGITAESVRTKVRRIERIASQENGTLEVYLIELDSVTLAATLVANIPTPPMALTSLQKEMITPKATSRRLVVGAIGEVLWKVAGQSPSGVDMRSVTFGTPPEGSVARNGIVTPALRSIPFLNATSP